MKTKGQHPSDDGKGLDGIHRHRATLSHNRSAIDGTVGNSCFKTGAIDLGQTSKQHRDASTPRSYGDRDRGMDRDYRRQPG